MTCKISIGFPGITIPMEHFEVDLKPECNEDFCDACGDCLACYSILICIRTDEEHMWVKHFSTRLEYNSWMIYKKGLEVLNAHISVEEARSTIEILRKGAVADVESTAELQTT